MEAKQKNIIVATHSIKVLDSRIQQGPIRTQIDNLGEGVFASHLFPIEYFAAPMNPNLLSQARGEANAANMHGKSLADYGEHIPDLMDGRTKQLLLPYQGRYLAITPAPSLNVMFKLNKYSNLIQSSHKHCLQPVLANTVNHGDPVCAYAGYVTLFRNSISKIGPLEHELEDDVIIIEARCEQMNVSSGYVSMGLPNLTAIGGFVHTIERKLECSIPFAFGIQYFDLDERNNEVKSNSHTSASGFYKPRRFINEIKVNTSIAFALKLNHDWAFDVIKKEANSFNRFCGGVLFDVRVSRTKKLKNYSWYNTSSIPESLSEYGRISQSGVGDAIMGVKAGQAGIEYLKEHHASFFGYLSALANDFKLIQSGYVLLNEPRETYKSRADLHAWAEPVFSLIQLKNKPSFFSLQQQNRLFIWQA